ncbi:hypothetical protein SBI_04622 [Streptomyces bingchenggensis BCW-1]|uniref:DUF1963 domain-containing protein n=1 Tax=Streptomyces bingchenggensis (strain BCW-1) TaxID=749414 RepID=D7BXG9_STRBB|nr:MULTISPECIES: hypothetical protein [Streptomyces]ADI07742.1 hypothetical protein SBI_04622 [Streptomyces bingchenggensis BCW-1]
MTEHLEDLIGRAIAAGDAGAPELEELASSAPESLAPHLLRLLAAGVVYPAALYRAADDATQRGLVAEADAGGKGALHLNHLLTALAQTRGPVAEEAFRRWRDQPPPGADKLFLGPAEYMTEGGWTLEGDRARELCGPVAHHLVAEEPEGDREGDREGDEDGAGAAAPQGRCQGCGAALWTALDLDTADERVAGALAHAGWSGRLRLVLCYGCAVDDADPVFLGVGPDGTSRLSDPPEPGTGLPAAEAPTERLVPGHPSGPYPDGSAIGGRPVWMDDAEYPQCPACGKLMAYIAQIDMQDISHMAGYHTFFLDAGCGLAAMVSQPE